MHSWPPAPAYARLLYARPEAAAEEEELDGHPCLRLTSSTSLPRICLPQELHATILITAESSLSFARKLHGLGGLWASGGSAASAWRAHSSSRELRPIGPLVVSLNTLRNWSSHSGPTWLRQPSAGRAPRYPHAAAQP